MGVLGSGEPDASDPFGGLEPADRPQLASGRTRQAGSTRQGHGGLAHEDGSAEPARGHRAPLSGRNSSATAIGPNRREERRRASWPGPTADLEKATAAVATARDKLADAERRHADATERRLVAAENLTQTEEALAALEE